MQIEEQPSTLVRLPSSHCSGAITMPSPQTGVQVWPGTWETAEEAEDAVGGGREAELWEEAAAEEACEEEAAEDD